MSVAWQVIGTLALGAWALWMLWVTATLLDGSRWTDDDYWED